MLTLGHGVPVMDPCSLHLTLTAFWRHSRSRRSDDNNNCAPRSPNTLDSIPHDPFSRVDDMYVEQYSENDDYLRLVLYGKRCNVYHAPGSCGLTAVFPSCKDRGRRNETLDYPEQSHEATALLDSLIII